MKILMITIDNRPVCYDFPKMCANIDDECELILPERKFFGDLTRSADVDALFGFLENNSDADYAVICADTLLYGGLIPSRRVDYSFEFLKNRVEKLKRFCENFSGKTFVFSSIMRISDNNVNEEEKDYWKDFGKKIFRYSYLSHKSEKLGETYDLPDIPEEILTDYLNTRKRNFEINKILANYAETGIFDCLIFTKDDCAKFGFNIKEAESLAEIAQNSGNIKIETGADELPESLLAKCFSDGFGAAKIFPKYVFPESIQKISRYEDISVKKSVETQICRAGAKIADDEACADLVMYVNNFENEQGELVFEIRNEEFSGNFEKVAPPCFYADIANANGADNGFVNAVFETNYRNFYGYSAWNTTGNTLGGAVCVALVKFFSKKNGTYNDDAFKILQSIRFLDDWAYQTNIRKTGVPLPKIPDLSQMFLPYEKKVSRFLGTCARFSYSFPWNRTFEIQVRPEIFI